MDRRKTFLGLSEGAFAIGTKESSRVYFKCLITLVVHSVLISLVTAETALAPDALNYCMDGSYHKEKPGPESELYSQCSPWKDRSCCEHNTTFNAHHTNMYNFNFNHCSQIQNMSEACRKHFRQDHCFYECSPNVGPWVVKVQMKTRKERYFGVPLCKSDCDSWFEACEEDYTCADNWFKNFTWSKDGNRCMNDSKCRKFKEIYSSASDFCEKVWDYAWKVTPNNEPCMRIWFNGSLGNPNDAVAAHYYWKWWHSDNGAGARTASSYLIVTFLVVIFEIYSRSAKH